jgi:archaetidylinositol phosphate synthase
MKLGGGAARLIPSPTAWTIMGLALASISAFAYSQSGIFWGRLGGLVLLISGFIDIVDGAVARQTKRVTKRGSFLDSTLDRVGEVLLFLGILIGGHANPSIILMALASSLLVSYARAKADSLGINLAGIGIGERSERLLVLAFASLLGILQYGVIIVTLLAIATFVERAYKVSVALN